MTAAAQKVTIVVHEFQIEGYQLTLEGEPLLLKTHRQIGEIVGKTQATAQRFLKQHAEQFPPPVTASIPDKPRPVPLTSWEAAVAYWLHLASQGNDTALALTAAKDNLPLSDFEIVSATDGVPAAPTIESQTDKSELQLIADGISIASKWMEEAGVDSKAIAHWRLNELQKKVPALEGVATSAQAVIAQNTSSPTGMIASQLAEKVSEQLERKVTAAQVNKALHEARASGLGNSWKEPRAQANRSRKAVWGSTADHIG